MRKPLRGGRRPRSKPESGFRVSGFKGLKVLGFRVSVWEFKVWECWVWGRPEVSKDARDLVGDLDSGGNI